jgi:hypothetical protein
VLSKLARYPDLLPELEEAAEFWKKKVTPRQKGQQHGMPLFVAELLIAYLKKDRKALDDVEEPGRFPGPISQPSYYAYKQFYVGLLYIDEEPEKAKRIFDDLARQYPDYPSMALNRMTAKFNLGVKKKDRSLYAEAYEEWDEHSKRHFSAKALSFLEPILSSTIMSILFALENYAKINEIFSSLDLPIKMSLSVIDKRVKSLAAEKKIAEALALIEMAKTYHQFAGAQQIQTLADLDIEVRGTDNLEDLKIQYDRIFGNQPAKLVKILPNAFNGKQDLYEFLVKEVSSAAGKMLDKINAIAEIKKEDKYNDIIEVILDSRLNILGMHIGAQSRGGHPGTPPKKVSNGLGERDIPIMDTNKEVVLVCEAFIYNGPAKAKSHLEKIFDYHHKQNAFVVLGYDTGKRKSTFESHWGNYLKNIIPATKFPHGMRLHGTPRDVTAEFGWDQSGIKVARSRHGKSTVIYHIFANILYKHPSDPTQSRKTTSKKHTTPKAKRRRT